MGGAQPVVCKDTVDLKYIYIYVYYNIYIYLSLSLSLSLAADPQARRV